VSAVGTEGQAATGIVSAVGTEDQTGCIQLIERRSKGYADTLCSLLISRSLR